MEHFAPKNAPLSIIFTFVGVPFFMVILYSMSCCTDELHCLVQLIGSSPQFAIDVILSTSYYSNTYNVTGREK